MTSEADRIRDLERGIREAIQGGALDNENPHTTALKNLLSGATYAAPTASVGEEHQVEVVDVERGMSGGNVLRVELCSSEVLPYVGADDGGTAYVRCVHGAYNADGSCTTCQMPNARPRTKEATVRCWRCKHDVPESTTVCNAGIGTQCMDSKACRGRWYGPHPGSETALPHDPGELLAELEAARLVGHVGTIHATISAHTHARLVDVLTVLAARTGGEGT